MSKSQRGALKELQNFKSFWSDFTEQFETPIYDAFGTSLALLKNVLTGLEPTIQNVADVVNELVNEMNNAVIEGGLTEFFEWLETNGAESIYNFAHIGGNLLTGLFNILKEFSPIGASIEERLVGLTERFADWSSGLENNKGFQNFIEFAKSNAPIVGDLFSNIFKIIGNVFSGLISVTTMIGPPITSLINDLLGMVEVVTAWEGFIPIVVGLATAFATYRVIVSGVSLAQKAMNTVQTISIALSKAQRAAYTAMILSGGGVKGALLAMRTAMSTLNNTMKANPILLVVSLLAGLGVALVLAYKNSETFRDIVNGAWKSIKDGFEATIKWFTTELPKWVTDCIKWFTDVNKNATKTIDSMVESILKIILNMISTWSQHMENMQDMVSGALKIIKGFFTGDFDLIKKGVAEATEALYENVKLWLGKMGINVDDSLALIIKYFTKSWKSVKDKTAEITTAMYKTITGKIGDIVTSARNMPERLGSAIRDKASNATSSMSSMASSMKEKLTDKITDIKNAAADIPGKIGSAIKSKVSNATSAMKDLAGSLIKKFKKALGINSPSRVFFDMAGWIIKGLVNGLSSGNLKDLGSSAFKDFAGGAFNSLSSIKDWVGGGFNLGKVGGNVTSWIKQAMALTKTDASWLQPLSTMAMKESGGRTGPSTINRWDSNWERGTPSMGLFQTIRPTFDFFKMNGMGDIMNPVHNAVAAIRYIKDRYGTVFNTPGIKSMMHGGPYKGYEYGGFVKQRQLAWLAENNKPEAIVPLVGNRMDPFAVAVAAKLGSIFENTSSPNGGFTVHTEFHQSEPLSPSEIKRKQLQLARQLANEWGFGG
ncbi:transglycosylase SLT domain-containing protein [Peribacillus frigoritolerans]|uniref:transglycosylase SLT domain-containing protein n=1 Tax=Peribacillus frigoritolerans TaxID=450367 RepID=UPI00207AEC8F|nr:transglycosylase SLT domain-containing protein [Peribacillus frigoritolerans]USK77672.1 transglycosylase SLT domain-containing protein [Peribacillus frigoritolerans]